MKNLSTLPIYRTYALASVKRYQSCYLGDQGSGGRGLHPTVIILCNTAALGQSDCYQDNNNKLFHSDRRERKKKNKKKGIQTSDEGEYGIHIFAHNK